MDDKKEMSNVETQRNFLTAEEFPEGAYGAAQGKDEPVKNKNNAMEGRPAILQQFHIRIPQSPPRNAATVPRSASNPRRRGSKRGMTDIKKSRAKRLFQAFYCRGCWKF